MKHVSFDSRTVGRRGLSRKWSCRGLATWKVLLGLIAILPLGAALWGAGMIFNIVPNWYQGYAPEQPIPFSHKLHAGQFQIPCLYCHPQAEQAAFAAVPGLETCMNCHVAVKVDSPWIKQLAAAYEANQPIAWRKVHKSPDFVHFNHKRHVAAGVECQTCHGAVEEMDVVKQAAPMTMGWCVDCHRSENYLTERRVSLAEEAKKLQGGGEKPFWFEALSHPPIQNADVSCSTCHY